MLRMTRHAVSPHSALTDAAVDITQFHRLMQDKYQERESRHPRLLRIWILFIAVPVAFWFSFALVYRWYSAK